ncbi:MAG: phage major tail tube protein [Roseburia sp.]|nr:phage major tail tube protein [Roseburia sp.]
MAKKKQPEAYIDFEIYKDAVDLLGIAQVTLPDVAFLTQQITGAGIAGNVDAVLTGMVEAMTLGIKFRSVTDSATKLMAPVAHNLDIRVAEQYWETVGAKKEVQADKYVVVCVPKSTKPGTVAPAAAADTSGEYSVYYYAGYKDGKTLWEIDPFNYKCVVDGIDYMADVRKALGK